MAMQIKRKRDKRNVSCVFSSMLFGSLALALITVLLPGTPQTNSQPCLIKSSTENVFVERKEIFRTENAGDTDDSRAFVFLKMAALVLAQIVSVFIGFRAAGIISNGFLSPLTLGPCWMLFHAAASWQSDGEPGPTSNWNSWGIQDSIPDIGFYGTNEASLLLRSGGVSLENTVRLICGQLSPPLMIPVCETLAFPRQVEIFSFLLSLLAVKICSVFLIDHYELAATFCCHLLRITARGTIALLSPAGYLS